MHKYVVKAYQKGCEADQARIGYSTAQDWIWPYAYDQEDLLKIHAQPGFDPDTRQYCFLGDEMVGYLYANITPAREGEAAKAYLDFPRRLPGHEGAADLLVERMIEVLEGKGVRRLEGRVTTMCPADIQLAERMGCTIHDWGYKVYYSYAMGRGKLDIASDMAEEINPEVDLDECAEIAMHWYNQPSEWCLERIREMHQFGVITHLAVRDGGKMIAACLTAPNTIRHSTAANYYIYTPDERILRPLLAKVIDRCVEHGTHNLIADLVNEHRGYEPVYQELGFEKFAEWGLWEKVLS